MHLGPTLRAARTRRGWTLARLAAAGGLSKGFLSQIEHDKTSPSLDTLERLAAALDLPLGDLLGAATAGPAPPPHFVPAAAPGPAEPPPALRPPPAPGRLLGDAPPPVAPSARELTPPGSLLRAFLVALPPGTTLGEPGHRHGGEETLLVLAGTPLAEQAGIPRPLAPGDALTWTPGQPHRLLNRSPEPARVLVTLLAPATLGAGGPLGSPAPRRAAPPPADRALRLVHMRAARTRPAWPLDDGRPTTDDRRRTTDYRLPSTDPRSPIPDPSSRPATDYRLPTIVSRLPTTDYRLPTTDHDP